MTDQEKAAETRDEGTAKAREAEEARQDAIRAAVDKAGRTELPKLGGPLKNPGLGS